jgi:hypothetical protein
MAGEILLITRMMEATDRENQASWADVREVVERLCGIVDGPIPNVCIYIYIYIFKSIITYTCL